ncbi:Uncharacterised protein [uncultured archaeon]|nr:Uncharacterised protein [uncultured archaeon]
MVYKIEIKRMDYLYIGNYISMLMGQEKHFNFKWVLVLFFFFIVLTGGCFQEKASSLQDGVPTVPKTTETVLAKTTIEKVSSELSMLRSKEWVTLSSELKRPRTTTLLWYHLKKLTGFEPKVVFGNTDKLKTALAIPVKMGGESTFPKMKIKGVEYYIIDPMTPEIIGEFDYGYVYDDPGSVMPGFFNDFRFNTDDVASVKQWMSETGVNLSYTDFPVN